MKVPSAGKSSPVVAKPAAGLIGCRPLLLSLLLCGCGPAPPPESFDPVGSRRPPAPPLGAVEIFVDASVSMRAFANAGPLSRYSQFLRDLRHAVGTRWGLGRLRYYRFGEAVVALRGPDPFQALQTPGFYTDKLSRLHQPFAQLSPENLTLLVTDLCPSEADIAGMVEAMRSQVIRAGLAVGIWGLRSQFHGMSYCLSPWIPAFHFTSSNDPASFRPYYLLVIGRTATVLELVEELSRHSQVVSADHFLLLTLELLQEPLNWRPAKPPAPDPAGSFVMRSGIARPSQMGISFGAFELRRRDQPVRLAAEFVLRTAPHTPRIHWEKLNPVPFSAWRYQRRRTLPAPEAAGAFRAEIRQASADRLSLSLTVDARKLFSGVYLLKLQPVVIPAALELPPWCREWSIHPQQVGACTNRPASVECNRTLNLFELVRSLWTVMLSESKLSVGDLYMYLDR